MKKIVVLFLLISGVVFCTHAQYYDPNAATKAVEEVNKGKFDPKKLYPGGNIGLGFTSRSFYIEASPLVGYWVTDWFTPGIIGTFIYFNSTISLYDPKSNTNISEKFSGATVGLSPFTRAFILKWLFAHAEAGLYNANGVITNADNYYMGQERRMLFSPMVGGGINFALGKKGGFVVMLLFNLNYNKNFLTYGVNQPYALRLGFYF